MQKKLIALAIAGLTGAAFAQSNVTIYGVADVSFENASANGSSSTAANASGTNVGSRARIQSNSSLLGFKGSENMGGLTAVYQFETQINLDSTMQASGGSSSASTATNGATATAAQGTTAGQAATTAGSGTLFGAARDSFVGIAGGFGTVAAGYVSTPYRSMSAGFDVMPGAAGVGNYNGVFGKATSAVNLNFRTQGLAYITPDFNGFQGTLAYVGNELKTNSAASYSTTATAGSATYSYSSATGPNCGTGVAITAISTAGSTVTCAAATATTTAFANQTNPRGWNLNLAYNNGPLKVGYSYLKLNDIGLGGMANENHTAQLLGASYVFNGATTLSAMYQRYRGQATPFVAGTYTATNAGQIGVITYAATAASVGTGQDVAANAWWLGVKHVMGANEFAVSYAKQSDHTGSACNAGGILGTATVSGATNGCQGDGANQWNLRYGYNFSKRTQAYVVYSRISNSAQGLYDLNSGPANGNVGGGFTAGADPTVYGMGIRHSF